MRTSIWTRSVVALATLAIGSAALAATPANAAAANGVTRDQIITAANGVRDILGTSKSYSPAAESAMTAIVNAGCNVLTAQGQTFLRYVTRPMTAGDDADGLVMTVAVNRGSSTQYCTIVALATADPTLQLSGRTIVTARRINPTTGAFSAPAALVDQALSGDAFVTTALDSTYVDVTTMKTTASGSATRTTSTTTSTKIADKKTKAEKRKAKKAYGHRIKAAKKRYAKALARADRSRSKKAKAKKAYVARRASAKRTYRYAIAPYRIVKKTTRNTVNRPFDLTSSDVSASALPGRDGR